MEKQINIEAAGNVEPPLFKILTDKGYTIEINNELWIAKMSNLQFAGENIFELAALVLMYETKGVDWRVSDTEVDNYVDFLEENET